MASTRTMLGMGTATKSYGSYYLYTNPKVRHRVLYTRTSEHIIKNPLSGVFDL
jgi:hypothetical protein